MSSKGFTLIELMIYLILTLFIMHHCIPWSIRSLILFGTMHTQAQSMIDCCAAHDLFVKDIFNASKNDSSWMTLSPEKIIWKQNDESCVGWLYQDKRLVRITGTFNAIQAQWHKKHTIPVLQNCSGGTFIVQKEGSSITMVTLELNSCGKQYSFVGAPRHAYS
jgi:hypothetical protein